MQKKIFSILLIILFLGKINYAQSDNIRLKHFNIDKNNVAISGYDPVAYFTQNKAVKGSKEFAVNANGIIYYLSTIENKNIFIANYKKYEPMYGGWCAFAMGATNEKVEIDPSTFKILDGKLYLFYNSWGNNTLKKWNKDETTLHPNADKNWNNIFK